MVLAAAAEADARTDPLQRRGVLEATRRVFAEQGYAGLTPETVAAHARVSLARLVPRYPDRSALMEAVIKQDAGVLARQLSRQLIPSANLDRTIIDGFDIFLAFVEARPIYRVLFGEARYLDERLTDVMRSLREELAMVYVEVLRPSVEAAGARWPSPGQARLITHAMVALAEDSVRKWLANPGQARPRLSPSVVRMMRRALLAQGR